jgi:hypothetical protein
MRALFSFLVAAALLSPLAPAEAKVLVTINKSTQRMTVSVDGEPLYNWAVSTGRAGRDTPAGQHRAFRMEKDHYSKEWDDAPMPNSIFFTRVGHAIHGTYDTAKIGSPASAGCVRLDPENAETLFKLVEEQGVLNTTVEVVGDVRVALARPASQPAATAANRQAAPERRYTPAYAEPARPRYDDAPRQYRVQPYGGDPYYAHRSASPYGPPQGYYEPQHYPRYYRW